MGLVGGGLANAVNRVPLALAEAQMGRRNAIKATVAAVVGSIAVLYITQGAFSDPLGSSDAQFVGGLLVSVAATGTGVVQSVYAERHFSRAVWLYNRELAH